MFKKSHTKFVSMMTTALALCTAANVYASSACEGSSKMTTDQQHVLPVAHADGHMLMLLEDSGPMQSKFLGNGTATDQGMNRLFQGNGEGQGYQTIVTDEGTVVVEWTGTVSTVIKDNTPNTSFEGSWEVIQGSGKFVNMEGQGVYDGYLTSETTRVINWKGTCALASN